MDGLPRKYLEKKLIEAGQAKYKNTPIKDKLTTQVRQIEQGLVKF